MHPDRKDRRPAARPSLPLAAALAATLALAGCGGGQVPNTYAAMSHGVGFGDYQRYLRDNTARASVPYSIPPETPSARAAAPWPLPSGQPPAAEPAIGRPLPPTAVGDGPLPLGPVGGTASAGAPPVVIPATGPATPPAAAPAAPEPLAPASATVADAQRFTPVPFGQRPAGAEIPPQGTTEIVQVASVPTGATAGPNVMAYALNTRHAVGTQMYRRNHPLRWMRWEAACLQFVNQDAAQEAFLAAGGPERDPGHLDPDGDGFACWWDPQVYRQAARLGQ